jgi:hypothetical protein
MSARTGLRDGSPRTVTRGAGSSRTERSRRVPPDEARPLTNRYARGLGGPDSLRQEGIRLAPSGLRPSDLPLCRSVSRLLVTPPSLSMLKEP